jgi:hypothetical protein
LKENKQMPEANESPILKFVRSHPEYPNCSEANVILFQWVKEHGNAFTYDSFAAGWTALREEIIQTLSSTNAERFLAECKDYPGGRFNAELMDAWITSQIGRDLVWSKENYWAAFEFLQSAGRFATEVEITELEEQPAPIHPGQALADATATREAEEAKVRKLRKMSPIGKPVNKALRALATKERRDNVEPNRLSRQDKFPEAVHI